MYEDVLCMHRILHIGDQQPYGERDKATNPGSKVGEQILQSPARDQPNW